MIPYYTTRTCNSLFQSRSLLIHLVNNNVKSRTMSFFKSQESTIYALATGGMRSAVAIVRVSGSNAGKVLHDIGRFKESKFPKARMATVKKLYDTRNGTLLDDAMVLWFPGPSSYTGEDCCEFHVHGGPAVVSSLLKNISTFPDCRMAEPGEFTRRAFLNNKMDLTEVDGLADLISAETEMQRIQALNQMHGSLGKLYESWRNRIAKCLANVEAFIDFGEDENIEADILETVEKEVVLILQEIRNHLQDSRKGERLRNGVLICILGEPNVGKSSLLNLLCRREAAIVSSIPGTTRDIIQVHNLKYLLKSNKTTISINGYPAVLSDTAGIRRNPQDVIETEGIRRALEEAKNADVLVLVVDSCNQKAESEQGYEYDRKKFIETELNHLMCKNGKKGRANPDLTSLTEGKRILLVGNKLDLLPSDNTNNTESSKSLSPSPFDCYISCKTLQGFDSFLDKLGQQVSAICANPQREEVYITHERYRSHLENCTRHLQEYLMSPACSSSSASSKFASSPSQSHSCSQSVIIDYAIHTLPLKDAMNSIGCITGHYGTEDILDIIFRDFCIGK